MTLVRDLLAGGWLQNLLIGILTLLITPFIGQFIDGRRGSIIGLAIGLTILIWIIVSVWIRRILKTPEIPGQSKPLHDYFVTPIGLTVLIWIIALVSLQRVSKAPEAPEQTKTLHDYFLSDFNRIVAIQRSFTLTLEDGESVKIDFRLHLDFDGKSEFISFYIPRVDWVNLACNVIATEGYKHALNIKKEVAMESKFPTQLGVHTDELKFNGSVFIYHESPLFESEKDVLIPIFKSNELSPHFRGVDYAYFRNNPPSKPLKTSSQKQ